MCRPSSNADGERLREPADGCAADVGLPGAEQFILEHAALLGPAAACFIRRLWAEAAHEAYQQSLELISHAHRYSSWRLEQASELALLYDLDTLPALRLILAENVLALPNAESDTQLPLPFPEQTR